MVLNNSLRIDSVSKDNIAMINNPKSGDILRNLNGYTYRYVRVNKDNVWQKQPHGTQWMDIESYRVGPHVQLMFNPAWTERVNQIPPGTGEADVAIGEKKYTINRHPDGKQLDVVIDGKSQTFDTVEDFLSTIDGVIVEAPLSTNSQEVSETQNIKGIKNQTKNRGNTILGEKVESLESQIQNNWKEIVKARKLLEGSRDGTGNSMTGATQKNLEETIEKMLQHRKNLIAERNKIVDDAKNYPIVPYRPFPLIPTGADKKSQNPREPENDTDTPDTEPQPESPKPQPEPEPQPESPKPEPMPDVSHLPPSRSISANISEVKQNLEDIARARAEERLRTEQVGIFRKVTRFFTRAKLFDKYYNEELSNLRNQNIFDASTLHIRENASDRFAKSNTLFENNAIETKNTIENENINTLAARYVRGELSREAFQDEFQAILDTDDVKEKLKDLDQQGTNIMKYLDRERMLRVFLRDLGTEPSGVEARFTLFVSDMANRKLLEEATGMSLDKNRDTILVLLTHPESRKLLENQPISVKLGVLTGGEAAFAIKNTDKTDTRAYEIGKWLQKHPYLSAIGTAVGITASSLAAGPIGNLLFGSTAVGGINALRRNAEFTDEHAGFEKRITQGTHLQAEIYQSVERLRSELASASGMRAWWIRRRLASAEKKLSLYQIQGVRSTRVVRDSEGNIVYEGEGEHKKEKREPINGRNGTTHRHFLSIAGLNRRLQSYLQEKEGFELTEEKAREHFDANPANADKEFSFSKKNTDYFRQWTLQGLARLDTWKKTGHNYIKSESEEVMEADYNILYENILFSSEKLGLSLENLRADADYKKIVDGLTVDYARADRSFDSTRTTTSAKRGIAHGAIYGASSVLFQWLAGSGLFDTTRTVTGAPVTTLGGVTVDPAIAQNLQNALGAQKYQQFVDHLSNSTTPETLWDTLTKDIFQNKLVGNDVKNQIMTFILNATDVQNNITKPELLIEASKMGLFTDIANHSTRIDHVIGLLKHWGYGSVDKTWLVDTLKGIDAGNIQVGSLSSMEQTKVAEALWCYVHRDGVSAGSHMWQVFMDKLPDIVTPGKTETIIEKGGQWLKYFAIPTWSNTFLSRLRKPKQENTLFGGFVGPDGKPINSPFGDGDYEKWFRPDAWKEEYKDEENEKWEDSNNAKGITRKVITRGDQISDEERDVNPDYPVKYASKTEKEVVDYMIDTGHVYFANDNYYVQLYKQKRISCAELAEHLLESNKRQKQEIEKNIKIYTDTLRHAHEAVTGIFKKHGLNTERLLSFEQFMGKVHFYTFYEFMAQSNPENSSRALAVRGFNNIASGNIAFNTFGLTLQPMEKQVKFVKHVAIHELLHGTAVNNYWELSDGTDTDTVWRRTGMSMVNGRTMRARGRTLNESIVETLAFDSMVEIFGDEYKKMGDIYYKDERKVLGMLMEKLGISKETFIQAAYNRKSLRTLAEQMEGPNHERKHFLALIMDMMDRDVNATLGFLNGARFDIIPALYSSVLHPSLVRGGQISDDLKEYLEVDGFGIRLKSGKLSRYVAPDMSTPAKDDDAKLAPNEDKSTDKTPKTGENKNNDKFAPKADNNPEKFAPKTDTPPQKSDGEKEGS